MKRIIQQRFWAVVLTIVALMAGQSAWAENTWTVENLSGNTFTITRSGDLSKSETIRYRTVSLSAVAEQHFTNTSGQLTFAADEYSKEITVSEGTPTQEYNKYQTGSTRKYRFEVMDEGGFLLADCDRTITSGSSISSSGLFDTKTRTIQSSAFKVTEDGYKQSGLPKTIASTAFYTATQQGYFSTAGAELHMTLEFQAKEVDDGYQYLQIITDNTTDCDSERSADKGNPGTPNVSRYMAGFEICTGSAYTTYKTYSFPVTSVDNNVGATNPWGYDTKTEKFPLSKQKFRNNCRASDGTLLLPTGFQTLVVRFDASGGGEDDWNVQELKAKIIAVDTQAPTLYDAQVSGGPHAKGNTFYVTLLFKEIVKITGSTKKLTTSWGDLTYIDGDGTNVLTFRGTIGNNATNPLAINSLTGTVKDLAGNTFSNASVSHTNDGFNLTESFAYPITYDLDGGTVATANPASYTYEIPTFTLNNPTKEGNYYFAGWTGSNGDVPQKTVAINQGTHGALNYTAHWTQGYSVFFYSNGGSGTMSQQDFNIGETKTLTANTFKRTYYIFTGWNTKADGSGIAYTDGQEVTNLAESGGAVTLYAQWSPDYASYWGADDDHDGTTADRAYIITTKDGLNLLANQVNNGNTFGPDDTHPNGYFFKLGNDINYSGTCDWNNETNTENNYVIIGDETHFFDGTFDGDNKTISGIRISQIRSNVGLFGLIEMNGKVKNLTLSNTRIYVKKPQCRYIGAIAGHNRGSIEDCHVANDVCIICNGTIIGGIAGYNYNSNNQNDPHPTVRNCTSAVTLKWGGDTKGGIVGQNNGGTVEGCFADGVQILSDPLCAGIIVGYINNNAILTDNYYINCTVRETEMTNIGVGIEYAKKSQDKDGARGIAQITLGADINTTAPTVTVNNKTYYYSGTTIALTYSGTEQDIAFEVKKASDESTFLKTVSAFELPGYNVTVNTTNSLWNGEGTENEPYLITNTNELAQLIYKIHGYKGTTQNSYEGKYFRLDADLTFSGGSNQSNLNDDGTTSRDFKGIFDGNGKYIKGITISPTGDTDHSIFGDLNGGTVKNLTIKNSTIRVTASGEEASDYAFVCRNVKAGTIESVTVKDCTIDVQNGLTVNTMGAVCATLESGTIGGEQNAKGCKVENLKFTTDGNASQHPIINTVGGICGKVTGGTVSFCTCNKSNISLDFWNSQYSGGIVGQVTTLSTLNAQRSTLIINCLFDSSNISNYQYAGGIVGKVDHPNCQITTCRTSNTVKDDGRITTNGDYAGGIVGWFNGDATNSTLYEIYGCYNGRKVDGYSHVGGIAGYVSNCDILDCNNCSSICGTSGNIGGVVGELTAKSTISRCFNAGEIDQNSSHDTPLHTGGIVGYINASGAGDNCTVEKSFNSYKVHGYNRVGGIAGMVEGKAKLKHCYNTGVVKGIAQVGGLIGLQKNATISTSDCYSAGKVEGSSMVGAVCGYATTSANFSNCYYDNQMVAYKGVDDQDVANITSLTHASMIGKDLGQDGFWTYSNDHYPQLSAFNTSDASKASTLVFPLDDATQNTTNLYIYKEASVNEYNKITLPTEDGMTWNVDNESKHLSIDNLLLFATERGIFEFYILDSDNRSLRAFEANFGISAQQPLEIGDTIAFRRFRNFINADQKFVYIPGQNSFDSSGKGGVIISPSAEGFYFKLNYKKLEWEESTRDYFWMVQEEPHEIRWDPIGGDVKNSFKGKLDGNGHKIIFKCDLPTQDYVGLFGRMEGHIKNLKVAASFQRDDIYVNGHDYVGALAGFCNGTIENCSTVASDSSAFVPTVTGNEYVGALVGRAEFSKIIDCDNAYCYASGTENVGEVYGSIDENTIVNNNSYSRPTPNQIALCDNDLEKPEGDKNPDRISAFYAQLSALNEGDKNSLVILPGRVLFKDGGWNTLCLPFSLSAEQIAADDSPLKDISSLMELDVTNKFRMDNGQWTMDNNNGTHKTGFDATTGTLYLFFKDVTSIEAGKPYIFKWTKADDYKPWELRTRITYDVHNPEFKDVQIDYSTTAQDRMTVTSADGWVSFKGTYSYIPYTQTDKSVLFIGSDPKNPINGEYYTYLYYPEILSDGSKDGRIGACRAYFQLNHGLVVGDGTGNVKAFHMNVDDKNTDEIGKINDAEANSSLFTHHSSLSAWFDLSGRRLNTHPTRRGFYIHQQQKIAIK